MTSRATELRLVLIIFVVLAALFLALPQIDLWASSHFYRDGNWLLQRDEGWLYLPYRGVTRLGQVMLLALIALFALSNLPRFRRLHARRTRLAFLLTAALLGPILLVDVALKDHMGRARPASVTEFGGQQHFSPAFVPVNECEKNCSFVSGHVATSAFLMAFGWLGTPRVRRRWLLGSIATASFIALVRMVPGGHFLSDTIFAWFAIYFSLWLTELLFRQFGWLKDRS
jgi:membrane-associated phospholipid phosphatase